MGDRGGPAGHVLQSPSVSRSRTTSSTTPSACGIGSGFEGQFAARVRDGNGAELVQINVNRPVAVLFIYHAGLALPGVPATKPSGVDAHRRCRGPPRQLVFEPIDHGLRRQRRASSVRVEGTPPRGPHARDGARANMTVRRYAANTG